MKNPFLPLRIKSLLASVCLLALSISMTSCDEEEPPRISLSSTEARFGFEAATQTLRVETGFAWSTRIVPAEAAEWCRLSLEGSDRPETINVYVDDNLPMEMGTEERHATIIFSIGGKGRNTDATLHVIQGIMPEQN